MANASRCNIEIEIKLEVEAKVEAKEQVQGKARLKIEQASFPPKTATTRREQAPVTAE
jgi:hypothetical protein